MTDIEQSKYKGCRIITHSGINYEDYAGPCSAVFACTIIYPDNTNEIIYLNNKLTGINEIHEHIDKILNH
jgi:hypothetical protein